MWAQALVPSVLVGCSEGHLTWGPDLSEEVLVSCPVLPQARDPWGLQPAAAPSLYAWKLPEPAQSSRDAEFQFCSPPGNELASVSSRPMWPGMEPTAGDGRTLEDRIKAGGCLALPRPVSPSLLTSSVTPRTRRSEQLLLLVQLSAPIAEASLPEGVAAHLPPLPAAVQTRRRGPSARRRRRRRCSRPAP